MRNFILALYALCGIVIACPAVANPLSRDILLDNGSISPILWEMNGASIQSASYLGVNMPSGWKIAGVGDFDGSGTTDVLWTSPAPYGPGVIWLTRADGSITAVDLPTNIRVTPTVWVGDFNGDGKSDILLDNGSNVPVLLTMNGASVVSATYLGVNMPAGWKIAGVGDFDGNGSTDVLWTTAAPGGPGLIWFTSGGSVSNAAFLPASVRIPREVWIGDYNGDGKSDILLDNGSVAPVLLTMNGATITRASYLGVNMPAGWKIAGIGDFDGNGLSDTLWTTAAPEGPGVIWLTNNDGSITAASLPSSASIPSKIWTGTIPPFNPGVTQVTPPTVIPPVFIDKFEAEAAQLSGTATITGAADGSDRTVGDLGGEASQRQAVTLSNAGDSITVTPQSGHTSANAVVIRYSTPDAVGGGGTANSLTLSVMEANGSVRLQKTLKLTSRYAWLYGGIMDGTHLYNVPANAQQYGTGNSPIHIYDEVQLQLQTAMQPGDVLVLEKPAIGSPAPVTVDFIELEGVAAPLGQPANFLSLTSSSCGGIATDINGTGFEFDGQDDSSYGSIFNSVSGTNPVNPTTSVVQEKDYYSTNPGVDALQDTTPNAQTSGLSMFGLADHNATSLRNCLAQVAASNGTLAGVYIPQGRFYARGTIVLPANAVIQGAGMWYTKFSAVDTGPPSAITSNGNTGIAGVTGNLILLGGTSGSNNVHLSNFSLFGNVTQRDSLDDTNPLGVHGEFTNSTIDSLWVEHYRIGLNMDGTSSAVQISNSRVRNTLADGIDFYVSTNNSSITNSQSRSTGDDGFAIWSNTNDPSNLARFDTISNSESSLEWIGNGFAVYGGINNTVTSSNAFDTLKNSGIQASTQFVPSTLPNTAMMNASISNMNLFRCGGNGSNQQFGALLVGVDLENVNGITLNQINIYNPSYQGIDIRPIGTGSSSNGNIVATINSTTFNNMLIEGPALCGKVKYSTGGSAALTNVCTSSTLGGVSTACSVDNLSPTTFSVSNTSMNCH